MDDTRTKNKVSPPDMEITKFEKAVFNTLGFTDIQPFPEDERPGILKKFHSMAKRAGIPDMKLFIAESYMPNSFTVLPLSLAGIDGKKTAISRSMLNLMTDDEVEAILGHELGHMMHQKSHMCRGLSSHLISGITGIGTFAALLPSAQRDSDGKKHRVTRRNFLQTGIAAGISAGVSSVTFYGSQPVVEPILYAREKQADAEAINLSGKREAFASALQKLDEWNIARGLDTTDNFGHRSARERIQDLPPQGRSR